jgi:hypothetical protein
VRRIAGHNKEIVGRTDYVVDDAENVLFFLEGLGKTEPATMVMLMISPGKKEMNENETRREVILSSKEIHSH